MGGLLVDKAYSALLVRLHCRMSDAVADQRSIIRAEDLLIFLFLQVKCDRRIIK